MIDFVAVIVVEIEDMFPVSSPPVIMNGIAWLIRNRMRARTVDGAQPNVEHTVFVRRQPAELRAVGRNLRIGPLRISKKSFARDQRRQLGLGADRGDQQENGK